MICRFTVPGRPQPKPRARVTKFGRYYAKPKDGSESYDQWRERVRDEACAAFPHDWDAHGEEYAIGCRFYVERRDRGDIDNLLGGVCDALNELAWPDDRLIVSVPFLTKQIDKARPRVEVEIHRLAASAAKLKRAA